MFRLTTQFFLPAGQGMVALKVQVMGSTTYTNTITYTFGLPELHDVFPTSFPTDGGTELSIYGLNLGIDLGAEYQRRVISKGKLERVAVQNSWRANQVFLSQNSGQHEQRQHKPGQH